MKTIRTSYLCAHTPLGKTYTPEEVLSYPLVKRFTSVDVVVPATKEGMKQKLFATRSHALHGNAMLRGTVLTPIKNESRSGAVSSLDPNPTMVLDIDKLPLDNLPTTWDKTSLRAVAARIRDLLPEPLKSAACLCSASSSMGITQGVVSMHLEFWLTRAMHPKWHRDVLQWLNLITPSCLNTLELSATGTAFKWRIDATMARNAQIRYIAMPKFEGGVINPLPDVKLRHFLLNGTVLVNPDALTVPGNVDALVVRALNEYRRSAGLAPKKEHITVVGTDRIPVITNPDQMQMSFVKDNDKFVYYNINGGDSNAYYVRKYEPHIVRNFKGEPPFMFEPACPEMYKWHVQQYILTAEDGTPTSAPPLPLVFRDPAVDTYFTAMIEVGTGRLLNAYPVGSIKAMKDYMAQQGTPLPDTIPDFIFRFAPDEQYSFDPIGKRINKYQPPIQDIIATESYPWKEAVIWLRQNCPATYTLISHVLGGDDETTIYFLNWVADKVQTKQKAPTAWVIQGVQGTGKGLLFKEVLSPLFGAAYCRNLTLESLEEQFNGHLEETLLVLFDEFRLDTSKTADKVYSKLKYLIGEDTLAIRAMRQNLSQRRVYFDCIFASNDRDIINIPRDDRRFNVAPRQTRALKVLVDIPDLLQQIEHERALFTGGMLAMRTNPKLRQMPLENNARAILQNLSESTVDAFVHAVEDGDIMYFVDVLREDSTQLGDQVMAAARGVVRRWIAEATWDTEINAPAVYRARPDELMYLYRALVGNVQTIKKFSRLMAIHGAANKISKIDGVPVRAHEIYWRITRDELAALKHNFLQEPGKVARIK